tara:strand:- start:3740 stop:4537 length:798 start_codon:yes stop_codon:yes gene_type:complete
MSLETGTYIDSLVTANPAATDALSQADDHLRLLKSTIKATFPYITGEVTPTHTEINAKVAEPVSAITSDGSTPSLGTGITADALKTLVGVVEPAITTSTDAEGEVTPVLSAGITAAEVLALIGAAEAATTATLLGCYPVGSLYTSALAANPSTLFGGTWESFGQGRVLVGHDDTASPDSDFVASSADGSSFTIGGVKAHTLSIDEIPSHTHSITGIENARGAGSDGSEDGTSSFTGTLTSNATGGGLAHNNVQPYIVVYMWVRTV